MSSKVERSARPNALPAVTILPPVLVPPALRTLRGLRALPLELSGEPVIYALCTTRTVAPGRHESEPLYVGLTEDLYRRLSEHHAVWWSRQREPFDTVLWWPHPRRWALDHRVTPAVAEEAFIIFLRPRYNPRPERGLSGAERRALRLHGIHL